MRSVLGRRENTLAAGLSAGRLAAHFIISMIQPDKTEIFRALNLFFPDPTEAIELRCFSGKSRIFNGFYRDRQKLIADAHQINATYSEPLSVFVCINRIHPDLYARRPETFKPAGEDESVKNGEVVARTWLTIDIDPDKATIVHRIFENFLAPGGTFRGVANGLNVDKVPTPNSMSNAWTDTAVKYILQNRKYLGLFIWGVQGTGSYRTAVNGEIEQRHKGQKATTGTPIIHEGKHKPIIDQATFDKVQAKMQLKPRRDSTPKTARKYLCTGLLRCGDCGGHMVGVKPTSKTGDYRYLCRKYQSAGKTACYCNSIPERPLVACLINKIQQHYATPKANKQLRAAVLKELERSNPKPKDTARLQSEIRSLDQKINGAEDVVLEAPQRLRAGLYRKLEQLTQKREHAQEQLARVAQHAHRRKENDKTVKQAMTTLKQLGELLHKADPDHVKNLLGEVVDRIELHFNHGSYGKIRRSTFREGMVYFRQDVLGSQVQSTACRSFQTRSC